MSDFINVFINILSEITHFDIFLYFIVSVAFFGVVLLVRKIVYA